MSAGETPTELKAFSQLGAYLLQPLIDQVAQPQTLKDRALVGSKACGLLALPKSWTPPFFVLSAEFHRHWLEAGKPDEMLVQLGREIVAHCNNWQKVWPRGLILRSSAVAETLHDRGAYKSCELPADYSPHSI